METLRKHYIHSLEQVCADLLSLGQVVEESIVRAMHTVETRNHAVAGWVIQHDAQINQGRHNLEAQVFMLLATQQPVVATDLRLLTVVVAIASELERIGDYASSIARRAYRASEQHDAPLQVLPAVLPLLTRMAQLAVQMLHTSLDAFAQHDVELARSLCLADDDVDALEDQVQAQIIPILQANPHYAMAAVDMLQIAHALERTADRATNIGERVIYLVTSVIEELNP